MSDTGTPGDAPALDLRVVRGTPTDEELAAVVAVLTAVAATPRPQAAAPTPPPSGWARSQRGLRGPLHDTRWG